MNVLGKIKELYRPVQPSIIGSDNQVGYTEVPPSKNLENFIYCYWQLKLDHPLESPFTYRVVSDGCVDLFFNNNDISDSLIMGFCKNYTQFPLDPTFDYVGVRFYPSIFPLLFKVAASDLSNKTTKVNDVLPDLAQMIEEQVIATTNLSIVQEKLNCIFEECVNNLTLDIDDRFFDSLCLIMENSGVIEIESELNTGLSPRQLRRIFNYYIGATPKAFSRVVRFQHVLNAKPSNQSLKNSKLFFDAGFYDQAHFIKDFKNFYGVTPSQAFD